MPEQSRPKKIKEKGIMGIGSCNPSVKKQIKGGNRWGDERTKWWLAGGLQNDNRDGNKVVDQLAKVGGDKLDYLVIFNDQPHFVRGLLEGISAKQ
ncbi:hypothetical protein Gogos_016139 [Gossypium gossypioides]|uniref:Uncharacterized protein n=1 Tax=Gossypium gossypioides TaxID=34282 RepID=A0A7J9B6X3_GOSGO|nr:hypothetical protein [Gossypium gossypioides]